MAPTKPSTKPFADLVRTLGDHLGPQTAEMGERFRFATFGRRHQHEDERFASFVAELRRLSRHCGYAANITTATRDQFVLVLRWESTQEKLVKVKDLSLETAIETAKIAKLYPHQHPRQKGEKTEKKLQMLQMIIMAAGTGRTIVASETKFAADVGSRATSRPCVSLVTKINTTR